MEYIEPSQLAEWIKSGNKDFLIIDVRGDDFEASCFLRNS